MGACNCSKNQTPPHGAAQGPSQQQIQRQGVAAGNSQPATGAPAPVSGVTQDFRLRTTDNRVQTFASKLQRDAEKVRNGGTII